MKMLKLRLWALSIKLLFPIYVWLHWGWPRKLPYPGASRGKWLDGLEEVIWCWICGDSLRFSLHIGNIYWKVGRRVTDA